MISICFLSFDISVWDRRKNYVGGKGERERRKERKKYIPNPVTGSQPLAVSNPAPQP
jgi:hypothetical protein